VNPRQQPPKSEISRIGLDTSKAVFTVHAVNAAGEPILRINLRRAQVIGFFRKRARTVVALEACAASHH
jgi:transposase